MSLAGRTLLVALVAGGCLIAITHAKAVAGSSSAKAEAEEARVFTDGRLRAGHFETIRVGGFPGKGLTEVAFLPTAICEGRSYRGGRTNARGAASFRVRIPGTFLDHRHRHAYFRDGERIDVNVTWVGPDRSFATGSATPDPILVRTHRPNRG